MKESLFSRAVLWLVFLFLLGPFAIVVLAGFSGGETLAFPPESYSLRWILEVWSAPEFRRAFQTSLEIGLIATVIALLLGIPVAYAFSRMPPPGIGAIRQILTSPLIIPAILVGLGLLQNIGIYSNRIQRLQDVPEGAKVSVANDPVNQGRGLLLLQKAGLIKLRQGNAVGASVNDVVENPKKLRFYEIEGPQLIHSLQDVDLAVVCPSYFVNAGKKEQASRALLYSGIDETFYAMGFVARKDRAQDPKIARFIKLFQQSAKVREVVSARFNNDPKLYTLPWKTP